MLPGLIADFVPAQWGLPPCPKPPTPAGEYYRQPPGFTGKQGCRHANVDTASDIEIKKE